MNVMRYHRYQRYKDCIWCCIITALSHPRGPCRLYWALVLLCALSTVNQWREPVQQRFDRVNLIDVAALAAFFPLCVATVMWHVIAWQRVETPKCKSAGLVYSQEVVSVSGKIGTRDLWSRNSSISNAQRAVIQYFESFRITRLTNNKVSKHILSTVMVKKQQY